MKTIDLKLFCDYRNKYAVYLKFSKTNTIVDACKKINLRLVNNANLYGI